MMVVVGIKYTSKSVVTTSKIEVDVNNPQSPLPSVAIDWRHDALQPMAQS